MIDWDGSRVALYAFGNEGQNDGKIDCSIEAAYELALLILTHVPERKSSPEEIDAWRGRILAWFHREGMTKESHPRIWDAINA